MSDPIDIPQTAEQKAAAEKKAAQKEKQKAYSKDLKKKTWQMYNNINNKWPRWIKPLMPLQRELDPLVCCKLEMVSGMKLP